MPAPAEVACDRLDLVILARLLIPPWPQPAKVSQDVGKLLGDKAASGAAPGSWPEEFARRWQQLIEAKWIAASESTGTPTGKSKRGAAKVAWQLSAAGRQAALEFLQVDHLPDRCTWAKLQSEFLVPLALGHQPGTPAAQVANTAARLPLVLISRAHELSWQAQLTGRVMLGQLAWRLLGQPADRPFTAEAVVERLLLPGRSGKPLTASQLTSALAALAVDSRGAKLSDLRTAALQQWLQLGDSTAPARLGTPSATSPLETTSQPAVPQALPPAELPLERFSEVVLDAARQATSGRFGTNKVFLSHLWRQLQHSPQLAHWDWPRFGRQLLLAQRQGLLHLSRADLVEAMNPTDVRESCLEHQGATFHFLRI